MKCPYCFKQMKSGRVKITNANFNIFSNVT